MNDERLRLNAESPPTRRRPWTVLAGLALALAGALWFFTRSETGAAQTPARPAPGPVAVSTAPVVVRDMPIFQSGVGTVTAAQSVTVRARIDGQLDKIGFTEGQDVKAGQMLAQLDPRTLQALLAQAQAQRAKDAAQLVNARGDLQRYNTLIGQDAATQQQLDTQKALVAQLEAALQSDDAQIAFARVQLGFTRIVAPISGRVGARLVDVGNIVHATDPNGLVVINQIDPIAVVFTLPEAGFQDIHRALRSTATPLPVEVYEPAAGSLLGRGQLVLLNNQIDTASGTVKLKARFANPQRKLWPGQYVNVRLLLGTRRQAVTVPAAAVQRNQEGTYVYAVDGDGRTVRSVPVAVAQIQDGLAIIAEGLAGGQRVVVGGQYKLEPGAAFVETKRAAAGADSASGVRQ